MQGLALRLQLGSRVQGRLRQGWAPVFTSDRAIFRAILALIAALAVIGVGIDSARAQQYFNGAQTAPNGAINGGGGVWNNTTTNWTNATGTASNPYDPAAASHGFRGFRFIDACDGRYGRCQSRRRPAHGHGG